VERIQVADDVTTMLLMAAGAVIGIEEKTIALEDAIGSHACSLEASMRVTNAIHLGCSLLLSVGTVNSVQPLQVRCSE
jgi:hypothetical protein